MHATFHDGPYDGIILDHHDINLYARFLPVSWAASLQRNRFDWLSFTATMRASWHPN